MTVLYRTIGDRIYPSYQAVDGVGEGRRIFFELQSYNGISLSDEIELLHLNNGLFIEPANSKILFPAGFDFCWGRYFPRTSDGSTPDNSITVGIDEYKLLNRNSYYLVGKVSQFSFLQGESTVFGVIGSEITFDAFIVDGRSNRPLDLSVYDRFDIVFCGSDGRPVVVDLSAGNARSVGFIQITIPPEDSAKLDVNNPDFDLRLYQQGAVEDSVPFRKSISLTSKIC